MKYTEQELIDELHRVSEEHCDGETPRIKDMRNHGKISSGTYSQRFGSWTESIIEAGFEPERHTNYSEEDLLNEIRSVSKEYCEEKAPTAKQMTKYGKYSTNTYLRNFDSWNSALEICGFELNHREVSNESILEDIRRIAEIVDDTPTLSDIDEYGKYSNHLYKSRWGTWNNALVKAGFEGNEFSKNSPKGKDHPHWRGGGEKYFGTSWRRQKEKALERDNYCCRITGKTKEEIGVTPHVHHINPRRNWDTNKEHEEMNSLDNLITLCPSIHHKLEGKWQDCDPDEFEKIAKESLYPPCSE
jgi:5-methylcytosine-specific restriction endonuclease McrA